jgi:hypothetical protein
MSDRLLASPAVPPAASPRPGAAEAARRTIHRLFTAVVHYLAVPTAIYTFSFFLLTYPLILVWSTSFYCDRGDGMQNEWNLWWVHKAILELHQSPWHTTWLHAPWGTTLLGHSLNPVNGFVGIPLSLIFSRVHVYNLIVTGSFVFSGLTAFWLARHIVKAYIPALFGGFAFTFTGYRFAHAYGHMDLISTEFLPLFLLAWLRMLERPTIGRAAAAGIVLGLVGLCDLYYVLYSALAGAFIAAFYFPSLIAMARKQSPHQWYLPARFAVFFATASLCCGPLIVPLLIANEHDPFVGFHDPAVFSADAFSAFVPGGANRLGAFTRPYWSKLQANIPEQCVYVGLSVLCMATYGAVKCRRAGFSVYLWGSLAAICYALSLGPVLHVQGVAQTGSVLPYAWMENLLPPIKLSGCPSRFSVMLALSLSILLTMGVASLSRRRGRAAKLILVVFAVGLMIDLSPGQLPSTPFSSPVWTTALRNLPLRGSVISLVGDPCLELYYQTLFERPMAFGYISRTPTSVELNDRRIVSLARAGGFAALRRDLGFVYVVLPRSKSLPALHTVYADNAVVIQELPAQVAPAR